MAELERERLSPDELRDAWPVLDSEERLEGFHLLTRDECEDFFLEQTTRGQAMILRGVAPRERRGLLRLMPPDDIADVLQEFSPEERAELIRSSQNCIIRGARTTFCNGLDFISLGTQSLHDRPIDALVREDPHAGRVSVGWRSILAA